MNHSELIYTSQALLEELRASFAAFDLDHSGYLDARELCQAFRIVYKQAGISRSLKKVEQEVAATMADYDHDNSGTLSFQVCFNPDVNHYNE